MKIQMTEHIKDSKTLQREFALEMDWEKFVDCFQRPMKVASKHDAMGFNCSAYIWEDKHWIPRKKQYLDKHYALILDYDAGESTIEEFQQNHPDLEWLLYTSFSHTDEEHAFRVVIPLVSEVGPDDIYRRKKKLVKLFSGKNGIDGSTFSRNRFFYIPCYFGDKKPKVIHNEGKRFNLLRYKEDPRPVYEDVELEDTTTAYELIEYMIDHFPEHTGEGISGYEAWRNFCWGIIGSGVEGTKRLLREKWSDDDSVTALTHMDSNYNGEIKFGTSVAMFRKYVGDDIIFEKKLMDCNNTEKRKKEKQDKENLTNMLSTILPN